MAEKKVQVCMMIKPSLYKKLGEYAKATGRTRSGLAGWLLEKSFLKETEKERDR